MNEWNGNVCSSLKLGHLARHCIMLPLPATFPFTKLQHYLPSHNSSILFTSPSFPLLFSFFLLLLPAPSSLQLPWRSKLGTHQAIWPIFATGKLSFFALHPFRISSPVSSPFLGGFSMFLCVARRDIIRKSSHQGSAEGAVRDWFSDAMICMRLAHMCFFLTHSSARFLKLLCMLWLAFLLGRFFYLSRLLMVALAALRFCLD